MQKYFLSLVSLLVFTAVIITILEIREVKIDNHATGIIDTPLFARWDGESSRDREEWQHMRLENPKTGKIPDNIRAKELAYAQTLPSNNIFQRVVNWRNRGPYNYGGRSRSVCIDYKDSQHILAGSVSGGLWSTKDGGNSWTRVTTKEQSYGVVSIVQDQRPGKSHIWYYTTGEGVGTSASGNGAFYLGNGVYKSTDNGNTWSLLSNTSSGTPHSFDKYWDVTWNIALDPSNLNDDEIYVATLGKIYKSIDGGQSWTATLQGSPYSYFTDVAVTSNGVVYATMSSEGTNAGIWRSPNGDNWTNITSPGWPPEYERIVLDVAPSNENIVYFLAHTPGYGQMTQVFFDEKEWNSLWKYHYLSGDGSGNGGIWENRSSHLPHQGNPFDVFNAQGSYNLIVKVHPADTNTVIIGGTNLYRSTDAFSSDTNITQIGGYYPGTTLPEYKVYPNQHPDQHGLAFMPAQPDTLIAATDGGLWQTNDIFKDTVDWTDLNRGFLTTQFYTINFDPVNGGSHILFGGLQDNGSLFTNSDSSRADWVQPSLGDGAFCAMKPGSDVFYFSRQRGKTGKMQLDTNTGQVKQFQRIDPIGLENPLFINPFILDPNDPDIMYMAGGKTIWRNHDLSQIPYNNNYDSISTNWTRLFDSIPGADHQVTALAASKIPANRLYFGTSNQDVYRIDDAHQGSGKAITEISPIFFPPGGYVNCIAVDPRDADKLMVVFSNYEARSLYFSDDGGNSWIRPGGNMEANFPAGPSTRWVDIMPLKNGKTIYWLATSVGVFATDTIIENNTTWIHQAGQTLGYTVTDMIRARPSDGLVVAATHGEGVFSAKVNNVGQIQATNPHNDWKTRVFPNPFRDKIYVESFNNSLAEQSEIRIYDLNGSLVYEQKIQGQSGRIMIEPGSRLKSGVYLLEVRSHGKKNIKKIIKR